MRWTAQYEYSWNQCSLDEFNKFQLPFLASHLKYAKVPFERTFHFPRQENLEIILIVSLESTGFSNSFLSQYTKCLTSHFGLLNTFFSIYLCKTKLANSKIPPKNL